MLGPESLLRMPASLRLLGHNPSREAGRELRDGSYTSCQETKSVFIFKGPGSLVTDGTSIHNETERWRPGQRCSYGILAALHAQYCLDAPTCCMDSRTAGDERALRGMFFVA